MRTPYITSPPLPIPGDSSSALSRFKYNPELNTPTMLSNARSPVFGDTWAGPATTTIAALSALADATRAISKDILQQKNDITAKNAFATLSADVDDFLHTSDNAIFKRQGLSAVDAVKDTRLFYEKGVQKLGKGLHPNAQRQFQEMAFLSRVSTQTAVGRHANAELHKAESAADTAAIIAHQKSALLAFTDDRVFDDNRQRMLEQVAASSGRLGLNREQADASLKQMDSDLQLKRALAFVGSEDLDRADDILESGRLNPLDAEALTGKLTTARQQQAFTLLAALPEQDRLATAQSPNKLADLGITLTESQMLPVQGKLRVLQQQEQQDEVKARENAQSALLARTVCTALGIEPNGTKAKAGPDPVAAYQLLQDADPALLDPEEKAEALAALEQGRTGQDAPAFVLETQKRLASGAEITNAELARAVVCGKLSQKTMKKLEKLREAAGGPRAGLLEHAFRKLDEAFGADSPELIAAHLKARTETMQAILEAKDDETARELLDLRSSRYLLPAVLERYAPERAGEETSPGEYEDPEVVLQRDSSAFLASLFKAALHGSTKGGNAAINLVYELGNMLREIGPEWANYSLNFDPEGGISLDKGQPKGVPQIPQLVDAPDTVAGKLASGVSQFLTGFFVGGYALRGFKAVSAAGQIGKGMLAGGISDFAFFDGMEANLSNLIQEFPELQNPVSEFLAASENDSQIEGRFKRALEGLGLGAATSGVMMGAVKAMRAARGMRGAGAEAVQKATQEINVFRETDAKTFVALREKSKRPEFLTPYTPEEMKGWRHFMTEDGVGFTLTDKMDIVGVVNNSGQKGAGEGAVIEAVAQGGKTLDCVGGHLKAYYESFGFLENEAKRLKWNEQYAPKGWNYDKYGRPDIYFFEYPEGLSRNRGDIRRRLETSRGREPGRGRGHSEAGSEINQRSPEDIRSGMVQGAPRPSNRGTGTPE